MRIWDKWKVLKIMQFGEELEVVFKVLDKKDLSIKDISVIKKK